MIELKDILNEKVEGGKVICDGCGWSWDISEGGKDTYTCHKCGNDNTPISEDLRKWFGKGKTGGWDRYNTKGEKVGKCGDSEEGSAYAACLSNEKAAKLGKDGRASFVKRKRAAQSKAGDSKKGNEKSKGQKPTFVKTGASESVKEDWSQQYKDSINCSNPKGFSQKAHCAGKKKNESMNEVAARYVEPKRVEAFLKKYPKVENLMQSIVNKVKDVDRGFQIFLHYKNDKKQEQYFGGKKQAQSKSTIVKGLGRTALNKGGNSLNSSSTYYYEWDGKIDIPTWGELFQYVWDKKNENMANKLTVEQKMELFLEKNVPTDPEKWSYAKSQAKQKFDVYPSAYANGWAAKKYKELGGGWKKD